MKSICIIYLLVLIPVVGLSQPEIVIDQKKGQLKRIVVNSLSEISARNITLENGKNHINGKFELKYYKNKYYVFLKDQFEVLVFSDSLEFELKFGGKGKGPGEGSYIHSYVINEENDTIILYDSKFRKLVSFDVNGTVNFEHIIKDRDVPYYMSDIFHLSGHYFIVAGISSKEWENLNNNKVYNNIYLLEIQEFGIKNIDELSVMPENIEEGIKKNDIISSNISNPFKLTEINNKPCVYNISSPVIGCMELINKKLYKNGTFKLAKPFFERHIEMNETAFLQSNKNSFRWVSSGNFFINIFDNSDYLIFHTSMYDQKNKQNEYNIILAKKSPDYIEITKVITYSNQNIIYSMLEDKLISLYYEKSESEKEGFFNLLRISISSII